MTSSSGGGACTVFEPNTCWKVWCCELWADLIIFLVGRQCRATENYSRKFSWKIGAFLDLQHNTPV